MRHRILIVMFIFICAVANAQFKIDQSIQVKNLDGTGMKLPWVGGLNQAQFSAVDINNDGTDDLFVFDRSGNKVYTFINHGTPNTVDYTYEPEYEASFPAMENWALIVDYNCDGIADIYTHTHNPATGIRVFKGSYDINNVIQFQLVDDLLQYPFNSFEVNLYVSAVDIPAIVDVNHDGDIDILTFQQNGGYVIYYENQSQENGHGCNDLTYEPVDQCWGDFFESGFRREDSLSVPCPFFTGGDDEPDERELRHTGSTLLAFDDDGDHDVELVTGDISFSNIVYLHNGGTPSNALITSQDTVFPSYNLSADVYTFPAAFLVDMNNDGLKDMIVTPNNQVGTENYKCVWYYQNKGTVVTSDFDFQSDIFLVNDMIDVGEGAFPVFFDADNDGLPDLLVGNYGYLNLSSPGTYDGQIAYYRNTGTSTAPSFQLVTIDYADILSLGVKSVYPTFGDLDGDGDADMITGRDDGTLLYFKNTAAAGAPANFVFTSENYAGVDVGNFSTPQLVDANHDGLLDLLIGERDGNLNYYQNTGTASNPVFGAGNNFFGQVDVRQVGYTTGYSAPYLVQLHPGDDYTLLVGCERGFIFQYTDIENNLSGAFLKADSTYAEIYQGLRATVNGADIDADGKLELLVGNYRGGVTFYNDAPNVAVPLVSAGQVISVHPNPASEDIQVDIPFSMQHEMIRIIMVNSLGVEIFSDEFKAENSLHINSSRFPSGLYFLRMNDEINSFVGKVLISH
ncbi:MAG: VCBS repeat-containing protein [Chitinophagaceae bacterium]|nr:VCBS repeat-containing protein [Chitinophagaceae bacterium]